MNDSMNVAGEAINQPSAKEVRTRSRFPSLSYHLYNTERFGEYNTCFVMDCVPGDRVPVRSGGRVESYTLKAPLMQSISKKKDFYLVPMEAILPFNWDKFYTNPVIGDDVPDDCGTGVKDFWKNIGSMSDNIILAAWQIITDWNNNSWTEIQKLNTIIRALVILEYFYSNGSLIASLGCHGSRYFHVRNNSTHKHLTFDQYFDTIVGAIVGTIPYFSFTDGDGNVKYVVNDLVNYQYMLDDYACVDIRGCLQYFREDLTCSVSSIVSGTDIKTQFNVYFDSGVNKTYYVNIQKPETPYNLNRLWAYQICCAHFYSNDHTDYIYSAQLLRDLMYYVTLMTGSTGHNFNINGVAYPYDYMSAHEFAIAVSKMQGLPFIKEVFFQSTNASIGVRAFFSILFSYRRSLRFVDYFTGARTRPLAVGDVNVDVNSGSPNYVNVVDVSRNIQRQRFFNAVNRFGRKFEEYIKGLTGVTPRQDYHNPLYLAHTNDVVYGQQVENTGALQFGQPQSVTSRLTSNGNRYQFEFEVDRPAVVIGISYYDIKRSYIYSCERPLLHMNRFDMFNPFMQFIGDQEVSFAELGTGRYITYNGPFGYQLRHMEYKQRFDQAAGGFVENLPGYIFSNEADNSRANTGVQSPDYIRSLSTELDPFYLSLSGYSLGSYFHFIVDNDNFCDASRPMAFAPSIL